VQKSAPKCCIELHALDEDVGGMGKWRRGKTEEGLQSPYAADWEFQQGLFEVEYEKLRARPAFQFGGLVLR
jgi:hypothetical protein